MKKKTDITAMSV